MAFDLGMIKAVYAGMEERVNAARVKVGRPLTLTEKILYAHLYEGAATGAHERGQSYVDFAPDRVAICAVASCMATLSGAKSTYD